MKMKIKDLKKRLEKWEVDDEAEFMVCLDGINVSGEVLCSYFPSNKQGYIFLVEADQGKENKNG